MAPVNVDRRHEITRLEAFSDAVFGFALTLLVVSLDVPRSYDELIGIMAGFPSFACCLALLIWLWHEHNTFFRRFNPHDGVTVIINGALLFVILFYVYPLKFMFDSLFSRWMHTARPPEPMALWQLANASAIYASGFVLMMLMFVLLYVRAYTKRITLGFSAIDVFELKSLMGHQAVSATVGLVALAIALWAPLALAPFSPMSLTLMGPGHALWGTRRARARQALVQQVGTAAVQVS
jgi:uncharacterized membrane protein